MDQYISHQDVFLDGAAAAVRIVGQCVPVPGLSAVFLLLEGIIALHEHLKSQVKGMKHVSSCLDATTPALYQVSEAVNLVRDAGVVDQVKKLLLTQKLRLESIKQCVEQANKAWYHKFMLDVGRLLRELQLYQLDMSNVLSCLILYIMKRMRQLEEGELGGADEALSDYEVLELHEKLQSETQMLAGQQQVLKQETRKLQEIATNPNKSLVDMPAGSIVEEVVQAFFQRCGVDSMGPLGPRNMFKLKSKGLGGRLVRLADTDQTGTITYEDMRALCQRLQSHYRTYCESLGVSQLSNETAANCLCDFFGVSSTHAERIRVCHLAQDMYPSGGICESSFLHLCVIHAVHGDALSPEERFAQVSGNLFDLSPRVRSGSIPASSFSTRGLPPVSPRVHINQDPLIACMLKSGTPFSHSSSLNSPLSMQPFVEADFDQTPISSSGSEEPWLQYSSPFISPRYNTNRQSSSAAYALANPFMDADSAAAAQRLQPNRRDNSWDSRRDNSWDSQRDDLWGNVLHKNGLGSDTYNTRDSLNTLYNCSAPATLTPQRTWPSPTIPTVSNSRPASTHTSLPSPRTTLPMQAPLQHSASQGLNTAGPWKSSSRHIPEFASGGWHEEKAFGMEEESRMLLKAMTATQPQWKASVHQRNGPVRNMEDEIRRMFD